MIPPATEWPRHRNSHLANTTQLWYGMDSQKTFNQNCNDNKKLKILKNLGYLDNPITYTFNSQGFRSVEFDVATSVGMAIGCSFTQGVGVANYQAWPAVASKKLACPIYNLGVGAASMDTVFRLINYWLPILKPKFLLVACPSMNRMEFFEPNGQIIDNLPGHPGQSFYKKWLMNPNNAKFSFTKNLLAITALCLQNNVAMADLTVDNDFVSDCKARDLCHPGSDAHEIFADAIIQKLEK
jgi:hypothetical protein